MVTGSHRSLYRLITVVALLLALSLSAFAWDTNSTQKVIDASQVVNAVTAPFNPFSAIVAMLLQALTPLAYVLTGVFTHKSGVATGSKS